MTIREELHIDCPPETAFDLMADVRKITEWNDGVSRAEMRTTQPIGRGSTFVAVNRGQEMESTITTFDRPERLDFAVKSKAMDVAGAFRFNSVPSGTELVIEFQPSPKGVMKLLFPVLKPVIQRDLVRQHLKFKKYGAKRSTSHTTPSTTSSRTEKAPDPVFGPCWTGNRWAGALSQIKRQPISPGAGTVGNCVTAAACSAPMEASHAAGSCSSPSEE